MLDVHEQQLLVLLLVVQAELDERQDRGGPVGRGRLDQPRHGRVDMRAVARHRVRGRPRQQAAPRPRMAVADLPRSRS